jgi:hypothetical protein
MYSASLKGPDSKEIRISRLDGQTLVAFMFPALMKTKFSPNWGYHRVVYYNMDDPRFAQELKLMLGEYEKSYEMAKKYAQEANERFMVDKRILEILRGAAHANPPLDSETEFSYYTKRNGRVVIEVNDRKVDIWATGVLPATARRIIGILGISEEG